VTNVRALEGVLPVDKPVGPTSHDVVAVARRWLGVEKVGHTGTLDPFASGLLLLCLGPSTRLAQYLHGFDKEYEAEVRLGVRTTTDDLQGEPVSVSEDWRSLTADEVAAALARFHGEIEQRPPDYSAKKVEGARAYERARRGAEVALASATVRIHWIQLEGFDLPHARFRVACSTGTYVRAIARDLGESLGVGGHLTALRRTRVGPFDVRAALPLTGLGEEAAVARALLSPLDALAHLPLVTVTAEEASLLRKGQAVPARVAAGAGAPAGGVGGETRTHPPPPEGDVAVALGSELVAVAALDGEWLRPRKVFAGDTADG
jgi:tRNA pseudouridine55 synthase